MTDDVHQDEKIYGKVKGEVTEDLNKPHDPEPKFAEPINQEPDFTNTLTK